MRVGFGLLSHNRIHLTQRVLPPLLKQHFDQGVIVDNDSTDGTSEFLERYADNRRDITLIKNHTNRYPGYARNQIVDSLAATVDLIVFMDNDIIVAEGCFDHLKDIFSLRQSVGQITPLAAPPDFLIEELNIGQYRLARTISNCSSAVTAVRADLFRQGLRWREIIWKPCNNQEIGEDYFLSRDIKRIGYEFFWYSCSNTHVCENAGRTIDELDEHFEYYLKTFADRGMLSRLKAALPHRQREIETYAAIENVPEIHGAFSLEDTIQPCAQMTAIQLTQHRAHYLVPLSVVRRLVGKSELTETEYQQLLAALMECREHFDGLDEAHPLFGQKSLQAALFFNRLYRLTLDERRIRQ